MAIITLYDDSHHQLMMTSVIKRQGAQRDFCAACRSARLGACAPRRRLCVSRLDVGAREISGNCLAKDQAPVIATQSEEKPLVRISKEKVEANRAEVVAQASRLFRQRGLDGPSVAELMRAAGLTHGGFYNHFASKADLQASALIHNFDVATARLAPIAAEAGATARADALRAYIQRYLSPTSRDADAAGCPMVAFGADVSREEAEVRAAYAAGLERYLTMLAQIVAGDAPAATPCSETPGSEFPGLQAAGLETPGLEIWAPASAPTGEGGRDAEAAAQGTRARAIALLATLVGGLSLARSIAGINPQLSDELLATTRAQALALTTALTGTEAGELSPST